MTESRDADLVARVLGGEREAFTGLVQRYQSPMYRYARAMGMDPDPAADEVQETFVKAYTDLASCRNPHRFEPWLFRILRNRCLDYLKNIRRHAVPVDEVPLADPDPVPDAMVERLEAGERLQRALSTMNADLRDAFLMKHHDDRTYDEMAEIAGASVSAMKMRVHRAREALVRALEDRELDRT